MEALSLPRSGATGRLTGLAALAGLAVTAFGALVYAPPDAVQGQHQRIFYIHVPMAWVAFLAFFVVFVGSVIYLWKRNQEWDRLAKCSAEVGVVFTTLAIITGALWGKPIWGTWWTWDARLTTTLILWLIYVAYLMLRSASSDPSQASRSAAVLGIVGFLDVPLIYFSTIWWRTLHPGPAIVQDDRLVLPPSMLIVLLFGLASMTLLYVYLLQQRLRLERMGELVERMKAGVGG